ncbi:cell division protein BolA [Terasakiispira papahanaumokuakeensis]|uniref:Cell division protein BolA n=1 Tax=Terasakiispira papahanaumokuakeensis TaxID=197479 RepID=A0A1E2V747_9GAMM|nr:BolA/IbaG family iron-sulfur metabolism protein [Terasakiispira papahanaumokuakeensis]ODC02676.1 cell division protein BolA [Terasakiispira papahanaumokuakeensis]
MQPEALKALLEERLPECQFLVQGDGRHFEVVAIGDVFADIKSPVKKQQYVYAALKQEFADDTVHAVQLKTMTRAEYAALNA